MSSFNDPEVLATLERDFVPAAIDSWYFRSRDDALGRFFQGFAKEALLNRPNPDTGVRSYQGHYIVTAGGRLLAAQNRRGARAVLELLERGRRAFAADGPERDLDLGAQRGDPRYDRRLPDGGLALNVYTRIVGWDEAAQTDRSPRQQAFMRTNRERTGFDHLWLLPEEVAALAPPPDAAVGDKRDAPAALARRIGRFHLVDNVRGEPPHYRPGHVRAALIVRVERVEPSAVTLAVTGRYALVAEEDAYPRAFHGTLEGRLVWDRAKAAFTRFDLLAEGDARGEGRWTPGAPAGTYRLRVAFELPPDAFAVDVPPQGMRHPDAYWLP